MKAISINPSGVGRKLALACGLFVGCASANAQVTGTRTIGVDYSTLAAAITDLNTNGISGSVTINVPAGYTETAPAGGYVLGSATLNASATSTATLTLRKSGSGADPLLTAPTGTSLTTDGIFIIQGTDFVTIDGIDLAESVSNTTPTTWMEWGYALVKLQNTAPFDGCQNVTIQNCTVTLNRLNTPSVGIYANNHIATSTTALSITSADDAMNNCRFYANTVQNCVYGISLRGYSSAPSPYTLYDQNNDVGGTGTSTGNTIQNYCGATSGAGIHLQYQGNANVAFNNINNVSGGGIPATSTLYGIYSQSGTNVSVTTTNNNVSLTMGTTSSTLYGINTSSAGTGTVNVSSNTITVNGGSSGTMYMIYMGGANTNVTTNTNTFYNINVATTGSLYLVYNSTAATPANITCVGNITAGPATPYISKTGSGGTFAGYYNNAGSGSGTTIVNGNSFTNITLAGSPTAYGVFENDGGTGQNKAARNNTISNITTAGGTIYGLYLGFSATESISGNTVSVLNAGTGIAYGINIGSSSTVDSVYNNRISNLSSTGGNVYGINISSGTTVTIFSDTISTLATTGTSSFAYGIDQASGTTVTIFKNKVYDISSGGTSGSAYGLYLNSGTTTDYNNLVGDIRTPNYNGAGGTQLAGIYVNGGTAHNIYYNSVYLNATSTGANFGSTAIYSSTTPALTLRNNIFANLSTPNGTALTVAFRRNTTTLTTYQAASNNNLFYAGTPGISRVIFYDGTTTYPTIAAFKTLVAPRDANSVSENPPFVSTTGSSTNFLHISTSVPTQIESGAVNIAGITTDAEGEIRQGNPGYTGAGTAPDIGAIEGNYMLTDLSAPNIVYTPLPNACSTGDRTFTATISDATGVPTSGTLVPRVYFKKGSGSWFSAPGTLLSGSATSGTWSFTISASAMGGLVVGDIVSYFVIAEDIAPTPNIGANPGAGLVATDVNTITTFPTSPNTYTVIPVLSGTYTVGAGMDFATLTAAVAAYNTSCVSGSVIFQLTDATYPSETFPVTINANASASPANTLTIRPAPGVSPAITGSSTTGLIVLNGADFVIIDGSNSPVTNSVCPAVSSSRDMTISNTSTGTSSAVVWIQTTSGGDSATHNIIRNCNIAGSGNSFTLFGVGSGSTTIGYTSTGTNNNSNRIENNSISAVQTGIFSRGTSATVKNTGTVINQNLMNATTSPDYLRNNGIFVGYEDGITISGNQIANMTNGVSNDIVAINLGFGNNSVGTSSTTGSDVTNATVTNNRLDNIRQTNTFTCLGIAVAGAPSGGNTIANNMISGVLSNGTGGDFSAGIFIGGASGGTTRVYYNAVNMSGAITGASYPTFAIAVSGTNPIVDLKNNIFVNTASTGSTLLYAIGLAYTGYSNLSSDRNDFYSIGANMGVVGSLSGGGTNQAVLADWQTTTGNDANSKNILPVFASSSDLHVTPVADNIPLLDAGVPVAITNDYDCSTRSTTPDIGLNEFTLPLCGSVTAGTATPGTGAFCNSGSTTITLPGSTVGLGISYTWESSTDSTSWSVIPGATSNSYTTPTITTTTFYRAVLRCSYSGLSDSATTKVIIYALPAISVTPDGGAICSTGSGLDMTASGAATYSWAPSFGLSTVSGPAVNANPSVTTTYTVTGTDARGCVNTHASTVSVTTAPDAFTITPSPATICAGAAPVLLSATGAAIPSAGPDSVTSGTITVTVPDASATGTSTSLALSGVPLGATITDVSVSFNITMTFDGDLTLNLTAPNGNTLNLVNRRGGGGDNFTGTTVSSSGGLSLASGTAPFTGTFAADAATGVGTTALPVSTSLWSDLLSIPNGTWTFSARDWAGGDIGTINSWTITINYTYNPVITWSPATGLFTDAGGTTPYTGGADTSVYAGPTDTTVYTATLSLGACSNTTTVTVNVIPLPDAGTITGPSSVCLGSTMTLADAVPGGSWMATNGNATVSSAGLVSGITVGADTILYIVTNTCGADTARKIITIDVFPTAGSISGPSVVCEGSSITLSDGAPGGVWTSSTTNATVGSTGIVSGVSAGTTTISYSVTNGCGTVVATNVVTVNPLPHAGTISGASIVCEAATITLTDAAPGGVWSASNGHATVTAGLVTGVSAGVDTIRYIVANSCGTDIASKTVTVNPLPVAGDIFGPSAVCVGSSISLTDPAPGGAWASTVGYASVDASGNVTGVFAGVDTIKYRVTNSCGIATATHVVSVNPLPNAGVITGPTAVCTGLTITLTDLAPGGTWSASNTSATVSAGVVTGVSTGTVIISYTVTNSCGTDVAAYPVVVNQSPAVFAVTGGGTYCAGGTGVHVGLGGSQTGMTYQLFNGSSPVGTAVAGTGSSIDFGLETAAGTYTVMATNPSNGCSISMTGSAMIFVNPTIPPTVSISAPSFSVCTGSNITLTAVPVNGGATPTYQWSVNGVNTGTGVIFTYTPANGDVVKVMITSSSCATPDTGSASVVIRVDTFGSPSVTITVSPGNPSCAGLPATFTAHPVLGGPAPFIRWTKNGVNVATGPLYTTYPVNGDNVYALIASNYACRLTDTAVSNHIIMSVLPDIAPTVSITAIPGTHIAAGQADTFFAVVTNGGSSPHYQWTLNGAPVPGATTAFFVSSSLTNGELVGVGVTSGTPCSGHVVFDTVVMTVGNVGVGNITGAENVRLIPNPNKGSFAVTGTLAGTGDQDVTLEVTNMLGQVIYTGAATVKAGQLNEHIDLGTNLANGMYILNLRTETGNIVFHFVLEQ